MFQFEVTGKYYVLVRSASSGSAIGGMFGNIQGLMKSRPELAKGFGQCFSLNYLVSITC